MTLLNPIFWLIHFFPMACFFNKDPMVRLDGAVPPRIKSNYKLTNPKPGVEIMYIFVTQGSLAEGEGSVQLTSLY